MPHSAFLRLLLLAAAVLPLLAAPARAHVGGRTVLLLTSYHAEDTWTGRVVAGICEVLGPDVDLRVEHLDVRRMGGEEHEAEMRRHLAGKYAGEPLAAFAAADDAAFNLLLGMRGRDLPERPLVFCGVNNFDPGRLRGVAGVTGVNEQVDIAGTVDLALRVHPGARLLAVLVSDLGAAARANREAFRSLAPSLAGRVEVREITNLTRAAAPDVLGRLPGQAVLLDLAGLLEEDGSYVPSPESIGLLSGLAACPLYTCWDFNMGHGATGGVVVSGREQGRAAGGMLARILAGADPSALPVRMESPNLPMFDQAQLDRFGVGEESLPARAVVLGRHEAPYGRYLPWLVASLAFIGAQSWLIVTLLANRARQRKAEARLQDQLGFQRALLDTIPSAVFYKDAQGRYLGCNAECERMFGRTEADLRGKTVWDIHPPELAARYEKMDVELFSRRERQEYEWQMRSADGTLRDVVFHKSVMDEARGGVLIGVAVDITGRKRAEEALRRAEALLRSMLVNLPVDFWARDPAGRILIQSDISRRCWGDFAVSPQEGVVPAGTLARWRENNARALAGEKVESESEYLLPSGEWMFLHEIVAPIRDRGEVLGIMGVNLDLTGRRRMEDELRASKQAAEDASRAKSEFLATMSHEVRTPLNGIMGMLQLLDCGGLPPQHREYARVALESSRSLTRILSDILDLSRIEAGALDLAAEPFAMDTVLEPLCNLFAAEAAAKGLDFSCERHPGLPPFLVGDAGRIRQVLFNLMGNAVKYTERGRVRAEVWHCGGAAGVGRPRLCMLVADSGPGIPDARLDSVFEPFTQLDGSSTRRVGGAGLGLAIVRRLVRLMGGSMAVSSEPGAGSEFYVSLPAEPGREPEPAAAPRRAAPAPGQGRRILVVEDEPVNRMATLHLLSRLGYLAQGARSGREALDLLAREPFAGVLMDIQMPDMDGLETTRRIRAGEAGAAACRLPVVALTAHAMSGDREKFLAEGMDGYLAKPVDLGEMGAELGRLLADGAPEEP